MSRFSGSLKFPQTLELLKALALYLVGYLRPPLFQSLLFPLLLPVMAGSTAHLARQDRGASGQYARVSLELLSSTQTLIDKGKHLANDSLQHKRKQAASSENNESEA